MASWNVIMYWGIDTNGLWNLPKQNANPMMSTFFLICIVVCAFFSLNLIISVVVDNFQRIKKEQDGSALVTEYQRKYLQTWRLVSRWGLKEPIRYPLDIYRYTIFT